jgi:uncharacterized protein RhaS with RHS repeats
MNRYYSPAMGRLTTADPYSGSAVAANPQSWNRYTYAAGNPVNYIDPSGLVIMPDTSAWRFCEGIFDNWLEVEWYEHCSGASAAWDGIAWGGGEYDHPANTTSGDGGGGGLSLIERVRRRRKSKLPQTSQIAWHNKADVSKALCDAWMRSGNGTIGTEAGFRLDGGFLGSNGDPNNYTIQDAATTNQNNEIDLVAVNDTFALFHTHPNDRDPYPSEVDRTKAEQTGVLMYVFSKDGLYLYNPLIHDNTEGAGEKIFDASTLFRKCRFLDDIADIHPPRRGRDGNGRSQLFY